MCEFWGVSMQHEKPENASLMVIEGSVERVQSPPVRARTDQDDTLTDRQRQFVDAYCGGEEPGNAQAAAIAAGYAETGAANMASRNLLNPKVQAEIERRVKMGRGTALLIGTSALFKQIEKGEDERASVQAAIALLDRYGLAPPKGPGVAVQINNNVTGTEASAVLNMIAERAAKRLGQDDS